MVNIEGLHPALVVAGLYNAARPKGIGIVDYRKGLQLNQITAAPYVNSKIDYLKGRAMNVRVDWGMLEFDETDYDRDNGEGAAQAVVDSLLQTNDPNNKVIRALHNHGLKLTFG